MTVKKEPIQKIYRSVFSKITLFKKTAIITFYLEFIN